MLLDFAEYFSSHGWYVCIRVSGWWVALGVLITSCVILWLILWWFYVWLLLNWSLPQPFCCLRDRTQCICQHPSRHIYTFLSWNSIINIMYCCWPLGRWLVTGSFIGIFFWNLFKIIHLLSYLFLLSTFKLYLHKHTHLHLWSLHTLACHALYVCSVGFLCQQGGL